MAWKLDELTTLPSLPTVAIDILNAFADADTGVKDVVKIMERDPALSGKVLEVANSVRFSAGRSICNLQRAVVLLGKKMICSMALSFSLAEASMSRGPHVAHFKQFWLESYTRALAAQFVAQKFGGSPPEDAYTLGLVSLVGRLVLLKGRPAEYAACLEEAIERQIPVETLEVERFGTSSRQLTAALFSKWKLPERFTSALQGSGARLPEAADQPVDCDLRKTLEIAIAAADFVATTQRAVPLAQLHELFADLTAEAAESVDDLILKVRLQLNENADLFNIDVRTLRSPTDLLSEAVQQLAELTLALSEDHPTCELPEELLQENSRLRRRITELTRESTIDVLTSLYNRRFFSLRLQEVIQEARLSRQTVGLLIGDIDRFKQVNDTFGHFAGDEVIRQVAECLQKSSRGNDLVARYGGEEFVVLLTPASAAGLESLAERIRARVEQTTIVTESAEIHVTISLGGAIVCPYTDDPRLGQSLIIAADRALYEAKNRGRNSVVVTDASTTSAPNQLQAAANCS